MHVTKCYPFLCVIRSDLFCETGYIWRDNLTSFRVLEIYNSGSHNAEEEHDEEEEEEEADALQTSVYLTVEG